MAATAVLQISYPGDPTIRGLARLPTMMTAADVGQGAGGDTNIARALVSAQSSFEQFISGGNGSTSPTSLPYSSMSNPNPTPPLAPTGPTTLPSVPTGGSTGASEDCSKFTVGSWDWSMCIGRKADNAVVAPITDWLNRGLFGLLALVLVGFGVYIFVKD